MFSIHESQIPTVMRRERQLTIKPTDVVVACQLAITPDAVFATLSSSIGLSVGECHSAVGRLQRASLLNPGSRRPVHELLARFIVHGVPHCFPPMVQPETIGVATAGSAAVFLGHIGAAVDYVWPSAEGTMRGRGITPLLPRAAELPGRNNALYELLTIIDAVRVGETREKRIAEKLLRERVVKSGP